VLILYPRGEGAPGTECPGSLDLHFRGNARPPIRLCLSISVPAAGGIAAEQLFLFRRDRRGLAFDPPACSGLVGDEDARTEPHLARTLALLAQLEIKSLGDAVRAAERFDAEDSRRRPTNPRASGRLVGGRRRGRHDGFSLRRRLD